MPLNKQGSCPHWVDPTGFKGEDNNKLTEDSLKNTLTCEQVKNDYKISIDFSCAVIIFLKREGLKILFCKNKQ